MPVQYTSITEEHQAVRSAAGLFDISHMGEILAGGPAAGAFLNRVLTNDIRKLAEGQGQYTLMCNERGGVIDDLYIYRIAADEYLLIVNASRIEADAAWIERQWAAFHEPQGVKLQNASDRMGAVAVQGPRVSEFIDGCFTGSSTGGTAAARPTGLTKNQIGRFAFDSASGRGPAVWLSRTGYTGEDGFEIAAPAEIIEPVWDKLLALGRPHGLKPAGLGARDTLRTEVCYPLYGHELDENTTPIEAGLGFFVALDKGEFVGRATLAEQKAHGVSRKLAAFKMTERAAPPRPHYPIWSAGVGGTRLGEVASGTQSPSLGIGIGLGYVSADAAKPGTLIAIEVRGKRAAASVAPKPLYRKLS
jgi:aminomethyltransferase